MSFAQNMKREQSTPLPRELSKHTPGKWELGDEIVIDGDIYYEVMVRNYGRIALVVATPEGPELIANAHLMATASDLLRALKRLVNGLSEDIDDYPDSALYRTTMDSIKHSKTTIDKAGLT